MNEAAALADEAFDALGNFEDNDGGVEPPVVTGSEVPAAQESGSPAVTKEEVTTTTPSQEAVPSPVVATPTPAEVPAVPAPVAAAPQSAEQAAATPATQEATGAAVGGTQFIERLRGELDKSRDKFEEVLATSVYGMTEEEGSEAMVNAHQILPKLAARIHMEVTQNILGTMAQILPGVVHGVNEATRQQSDLTNQFFQRWPELKKDQDYGEVMNLARTFRAQYPQASAKEMIEHVGAMAIVKLGRLPAAAPAAPVAQAPGVAAYRPAATVPGSVQPAPVQDFWSGVAENLDE